MSHDRDLLKWPSIPVALVVTAAVLFAVRGTARFMDTESSPATDRRAIYVPSVVGQSLCQAQKDLSAEGLTVVKVTGRRSDLVELPATVVGQIPSAAERYREPEPILLEVLGRSSVGLHAVGPIARTFPSRRMISRLVHAAGLPHAAVLRAGTPTTLRISKSGACEPVITTTYRGEWGRATLLQTLGQIVPHGRDVWLRNSIGQKLNDGFYWREGFYVLGLTPTRRTLVKSLRWTRFQNETLRGRLHSNGSRFDEA